jgi:hypothetical protein
MTRQSNERNCSGIKAEITLLGLVQKIFPAIEPGNPDKIQILVKGAEDLYREIRIDNLFQDSEGSFVNLKVGDEVEIAISAKLQKAPVEDS